MTNILKESDEGEMRRSHRRRERSIPLGNPSPTLKTCTPFTLLFSVLLTLFIQVVVSCQCQTRKEEKIDRRRDTTSTKTQVIPVFLNEILDRLVMKKIVFAKVFVKDDQIVECNFAYIMPVSFVNPYLPFPM